MKNQTYWSNRQKQLNSQLEKDEEKLRQKLSAEYDKQSKRLEKEIAAYYQQYGANDVIEYRTLLLSLSDADRQLLMERMDEFAQKYPQYAHLTPVRESIYKLDRLEGLQTSIRMQQLEIGAIDNIQLEQHLSEYAAKSANVAAEQLGFGKNFYNINSDVVKMTINKKWINDKNFSERIWDNRKKLADYLCNDFASAVVRGDSYQECINALKGRFNNVSRNDMFRLIYTEDTYVTNEASAQTFEEYYEQYQFHTVDGNACKTCKGINEKIFYFKDRKPGLNFPPLHAWCRCYYTVEVDDWDKWMDDYVDKKEKSNIETSNGKIKNIEVRGGFYETNEISEDIKTEIIRSINKIQSEYEVKVDDFSYEDISKLFGRVPFQFQAINDSGKYKSKFVINKGFNWEENLEFLNERIYNKNYKKGILASKNTEDLIYHEMAHFMSFQDCETYYDFYSKERELRREFISGVSIYSDRTEDGAETIAEGFVRMKNNEEVDARVKKLVENYIERWKK